MRWSVHDNDRVGCLVGDRVCPVEVHVFHENPEGGERVRLGLLTAFDTDEGWADQYQADKSTKRITGKITACFEIQLPSP